MTVRKEGRILYLTVENIFITIVRGEPQNYSVDDDKCSRFDSRLSLTTINIDAIRCNYLRHSA